MVLASIGADPRLDADDLELRRGGVSYTIDTLREITKRRGGRPGLVLGDDLAADFSRWREAEEISRLAEIIVARRLPGGMPGGNAGDGERRKAGEFPYPCRFLDNEVMNLSSALIRERIASAGPWRSLVPPGARHIIEDRGLYWEGGRVEDIPGSLIARVEDAVREALSRNRFLHSRNTALLARDIALRYGLSGGGAYLAGIAHDWAKTLEPGLSHGPAAAVLLRERFGIHNREILEAVEVHTTGRPGMGDLARAVFIADKIEHSRGAAGDSLRLAAFSSLDEWFYAVLEDSLRWLEKTDIKPAEDTLRLRRKANVKRG
jgi:nicotinate-nucleotide adenylyltransferase